VSLGPFGGASMSGLIVGFGGVREVFPLITAGAVAARSGAEFAAELGAMKTTQQVDALEVMGLDPVRLLVVPRVIAAALGTPLCVLCACGAGMLGAQLTGTRQLHVDRGLMWSTLWQGVVLPDLIVAAVKGVVLGTLIGLVATREGLRAEGGPAGVGRAANRAVVIAMCVACAADFVISMAVYSRGAAS
jgi:phospholipid/cholesterol/gamma-HCH transport system permease protein